MKKNRVGRLTLPDLQTYYKATVIKIELYWHKDRHIDQQNRIESPEVNPHVYGQMIFNKDVKPIQWGKRQSFQQIVLGKLNIHLQKKEIGPSPNTIHKN